MTKLRGKLEVYLEGRGKVSLRLSNHIATGGEGSVYKKSKTIIKLFTDQSRLSQENIAGKISLLSNLTHPYIVAPQDIVCDTTGQMIGYYMDYVSGEPLARVFTNEFRKRSGFTDDDASVLVDRMRGVVQFAHSKNALLVDANEMNWLSILTSGDVEPRVIDVDSWAIAQWKPTVIMPSIRDWHTGDFSVLTDWFAWAIVTFQVYVGIHPYKGKMVGYKSSELEKRMKDNASVFSQGVRLNRSVRDLSKIPGRLCDWYEGVFQRGERSVPPSPFEGGTAQQMRNLVKHVQVTSSGTLAFDKVFDAGKNDVTRVFSCGVVLTSAGELSSLSEKRVIVQNRSQKCEVVSVHDGWLVADVLNGGWTFSFIRKNDRNEFMLARPVLSHNIFCYDNRMFCVTEKGVSELVVTQMGKIGLSVKNSWSVLIRASQWFDGVGVQDALGAMYIIAPFGDNSCAHIRARELDGMRPLAGVSGERFVSIIAIDKQGVYQKCEFAFDRNYGSYMYWQGEVCSPELNITALPKMVCATIIEDGKIVVFVPSSGTMNTISDKNIHTGMMLTRWKNKVLIVDRGVVWHVRMT